MNDLVRDEIWVTVPVTRGPRVFVRTVELSELCLLMCPSPRCGQLPAWAQFWVDMVMPLTLRLACSVFALLVILDLLLFFLYSACLRPPVGLQL